MNSNLLLHRLAAIIGTAAFLLGGLSGLSAWTAWLLLLQGFILLAVPVQHFFFAGHMPAGFAILLNAAYAGGLLFLYLKTREYRKQRARHEANRKAP